MQLRTMRLGTPAGSAMLPGCSSILAGCSGSLACRPKTRCRCRPAALSRLVADRHRASCQQLRAAPRYNPQNVDNPQVMPEPGRTAQEVVQVQLDALMRNDEPWSNHGVQTSYEFGEDIGGLDRSVYFGRLKDLYHMDHFAGHFLNVFPELLDIASYELSDPEEQPDGCQMVYANVSTRRGSQAKFSFLLAAKSVGKKKGSLMTRTLLRV